MFGELRTGSGIAQRLQKYIDSDLFSIKSNVAKSVYWDHHANEISATVGKESVQVSGNSGFYIPEYHGLMHKVCKGIAHPKRTLEILLDKIWEKLRFEPRMMTYEAAFDAVMQRHEISHPLLSPFRINHMRLLQNRKVFGTTSAVRAHYKSWAGRDASWNILLHYYYQNILQGNINESEVSTVLEIGAGNGNFPSIVYHDWAPVRVILVDLPETLTIAIPYLASLFPEAKFVLPHEVASEGFPEQFDFCFLTVDQLDELPDSCINLAMNCHSFQEMSPEQIDIYFQLVQRVCIEAGYFFVANRVEKIPCTLDQVPPDPDLYTEEHNSPVIRFSEYPWFPKNDVLFYEISRLSRLVQLDGISLRLERIHK